MITQISPKNLNRITFEVAPRSTNDYQDKNPNFDQHPNENRNRILTW